MKIFWFLPTHGDSRYLGTSHGARSVGHGYLRQIAQATDALGYEGVLIPTGRSCEDAWVVASSLVPFTERLKFLVAIRPGIISPTVSARQAATLDRFSNGRILINVATGGDPDEQHGDGSFLTHAERYEVTDEFLRIWRGVSAGETVNFKGTAVVATSSRSRRISGPAWAWCAAVQGRRWWAIRKRSLRASRNMRRSESRPSSSPATRISRKRTGWRNWCFRSCRSNFSRRRLRPISPGRSAR